MPDKRKKIFLGFSSPLLLNEDVINSGEYVLMY
jgi:hypothetical protein